MRLNYLRTQRFKRLIHWLHFDSVRGVLHEQTVENFVLYSAAEFLCELGKTRERTTSILGTPIERVVFSDCLRV